MAQKHTILAGLERHGSGWRWRFTVAGKRHTYKLLAVTEDEAILEVAALRKQRSMYLFAGWGEEIANYLALNRFSERVASEKLRILKLFADKTRTHSSRDVRGDNVAHWLGMLMEAHPATTTPASYYRVVASFFGWLVRMGRISESPCAGIAAPRYDVKLRDVFLTSEEVHLLLERARLRGDLDLEWLIVLGAECGMRRSEITSARFEWIAKDGQSITIPKEDGRFKRKGMRGKLRTATIPLSLTFRELWSRDGRSNGYFIAPASGWGRQRYRVDFRKRYESFMAANDFGHVTVHDLRRSFGSNRISAGVSLDKVANWMGIDRDTAWSHYMRFIPNDGDINLGTARKAQETGVEVGADTCEVEMVSRLARIERLYSAGILSEVEREQRRQVVLQDL